MNTELMEKAVASKDDMECILAKLQDIQNTQMLLNEKIITTQIEAFHYTDRDFDRIMNRIHDLVCIGNQEVKKAIELISAELQKTKITDTDKK